MSTGEIHLQYSIALRWFLLDAHGSGCLAEGSSRDAEEVDPASERPDLARRKGNRLGVANRARHDGYSDLSAKDVEDSDCYASLPLLPLWRHYGKASLNGFGQTVRFTPELRRVLLTMFTRRMSSPALIVACPSIRNRYLHIGKASMVPPSGPTGRRSSCGFS